MRLADQMLLAQIREALLGHIPEQQWALVEQEVEKAGGVDKVGGYTGVLLRDAIEKAKKNKVETVMSEFKAGKLKSSSGKKVKSRKQAIAIALSEQRRVKKEMLEKASFGGDRSAAGRYAAEQRWKGHAKSDKPVGYTDGRVGRVGAMGNFKNKALYQLAGEIEEAYRRQGKKVPAALKPYLEAMYSLDRIDSNYGMDSGQMIVGYFLSNLTGLKNEGGVKEIKDELKRRIKEGESRDEQTVQSDKPSGEERDAKKIKMMSEGAASQPKPEKVAERKAQMSRDEQGVVNWKGMTRERIQEALEGSLEELRAVQTGELSPMRWGRIRSKKLALTEIVDMISDTRSMLQAMDEFEDETLPGYFAS
jgi:hypothetical protein